jgi:crotonobetainyl-CoA:carnitine CoA-transferase CaiB-like acyl-CoA transferase
MSTPLQGYRIVDFSQAVSGPLATMLLADQGADVIKVEPVVGGDTVRVIQVRVGGITPLIANLNRGKRAIALDITKPAGLDFALRLCDTADVFVQNFRPGVCERLGLGPDALLARNPDLIYVNVTGYGQSGPYRDRRVYDPVIQGLTGHVDAQLNPEIPVHDLHRTFVADKSTSYTVAQAVTSALLARERGLIRGQVVDVSLRESVFHLMGPLISLFKTTGEMQGRMGAGLPYSVPRGTYQCADGKWVGLSASSNSVAARVMKLLDLDGDERVTTFDGRVAHRELVEGAMSAYCAARTQAQVIAEFEEAEAAVGPVLDMSDIAADPHYAARDAIVQVGDTWMQGLIAKLSATPGALNWAGRSLDADGDAIREHGWG